MKTIVNFLAATMGLALANPAFATCAKFSPETIEKFHEILRPGQVMIADFCEFCGASAAQRRPVEAASEPFRMQKAEINLCAVKIDGMRVDVNNVYYQTEAGTFAALAEHGLFDKKSNAIHVPADAPIYPDLPSSAFASAKKWIDEAGDCQNSMKSSSNELRSDLLVEAYQMITDMYNPPMQYYKIEANAIMESPHYTFVKTMLQKATSETRPYCDVVSGLNPPPDFARETAMRSQAATGPVMSVQESETVEVSRISDIENKNLIIQGRDLMMLENFDPATNTAYSNVNDFFRTDDESGKKCFFEYTPSPNFVSASSSLQYAIDPNADVILKVGKFIPGIKIVNSSIKESSPLCQNLDSFLQPTCMKRTKEQLVWFPPGQLLLQVVDSKGNPIRSQQGNVELKVYNNSATGALKCLIHSNFALIKNPGDTYSQATQMSFNLD